MLGTDLIRYNISQVLSQLWGVPYIQIVGSHVGTGTYFGVAAAFW